VKRLVDHWLNKYDWRIHEAELNRLPQYTLPIQPEGFNVLNIHFVHQPSTRPDAIPLIFIHGWPGHFHEVSKILQPLTSPPPGVQAFHVVAPSIPGFAFSSNPTTKGFNIHKIAETFNLLMISLGYEKYVAQGGDWGSSISRVLGILYPANCCGVHVNLQKGVDPPKWYRNPWLWVKMHSQLVHYSREEETMMARSRWFEKEETGYRVSPPGPCSRIHHCGRQIQVNFLRDAKCRIFKLLNHRV
jgi:pimeloyl-ACP methyl ester carboxylesterase